MNAKSTKANFIKYTYKNHRKIAKQRKDKTFILFYCMFNKLLISIHIF